MISPMVSPMFLPSPNGGEGFWGEPDAPGTTNPSWTGMVGYRIPDTAEDRVRAPSH